MQASTTKERKAGLAQAIVACVCALVLALGTMLPTGTAALADDESGDTSSYTISIKNATAGTYSAYRIFSGNFDDDGTMGDAEVNSAVQSAVISALSTATDNSTNIDASSYSTTTALSNALADAIAALSDEQADAFAEALESSLSSVTPDATTTVTTDGDTATLTVSETGYYIVLQSASSGDSDSDLTFPILVAVDDGGASVSAKWSTPTAEKERVLNSDGSAITWNNDGTASISYTVTGTVASNVADYTSYVYNFVDTLPAGVSTSLSDGVLSNISWTVTAYANDDAGSSYSVTDSYTPSVARDDDGQSVVTWSCSNLISAVSGAGGSLSSDYTVVLSYTLTLSASEVETLFAANSSYDELTNTASIVFSDDPYADGDGSTDTTPDDPDTPDNPPEGGDTGDGLSYYTLTVLKVDTNNSNLSGAQFTLTNSSGDTVGTYAANDDGYTFTFNGLEAGVTYTLTETTTPDGYKSIDPITFTITASESDGGSVSLSVTESSDPSEAASITVDSDAGGVTATVKNTEGVDLPLTGQQGIMLGLLIGAAIIVVSCVAIARNRRKDAEGAHAA